MGTDYHRFIRELNVLYLDNGLDLITAPDASVSTSPITPGTSTRSTARSISTQTSAPLKTQAAQTAASSIPAPKATSITISTEALADVLSPTTTTTDVTEQASITTRRLQNQPQPQAMRPKSPTTNYATDDNTAMSTSSKTRTKKTRKT
ncbi:glutamate--tRNA ligase-like [Procambarus clarkii]|uniref:glutamate--tRNA ligase-like n=1 Tax=Procambarus clarkii TaxID=6728 RepID=UPI003742371A